jgi:hypothetical protein
MLTVAGAPDGGKWVLGGDCVPYGWNEVTFDVPDECP